MEYLLQFGMLPLEIISPYFELLLNFGFEINIYVYIPCFYVKISFTPWLGYFSDEHSKTDADNKNFMAPHLPKLWLVGFCMKMLVCIPE